MSDYFDLNLLRKYFDYNHYYLNIVVDFCYFLDYKYYLIAFSTYIYIIVYFILTNY
jgi:hypothetical protein